METSLKPLHTTEAHREEVEGRLDVLEVVLVVVVPGEEGGEEEHLGQVREEVEEAGRGALPEGVVLRPNFEFSADYYDIKFMPVLVYSQP